MKLSEIVKKDELPKKVKKYSNVNGLSWTESSKLSGSIFQLQGVKARTQTEIQHPAKFPDQLAELFIKTYTKPGYVILDPFSGTGTTGIVAHTMKRKAILLEIGEKWVKIARERTRMMQSVKIIKADSTKYLKKMKQSNIRIDYTFTSPPYANLLHNTYNDVGRKKKGLPTIFTEDPNDLGNMDYEQCLDTLVEMTRDIYDITNPGRYASFVIMNYISKDFIDGKRKGDSYQHPLAWEFAIRVQKETKWRLLPESIWDQPEKPRLGFGFPKYFYHGNQHQYVIHLHKE